MKKKFYYFYIINNLLNGRFYVGIHSTYNLNDGYFGSGKLLKLAIKAHGKDNFELTILRFFDSKEEMAAFEAEVVTQRFLDHYKGITYNLTTGGTGGDTFAEKSENELIAIGEKIRKHHTKYTPEEAKIQDYEATRRWQERNPEQTKKHHNKANKKYRDSHLAERSEYHRQYYLKKKTGINCTN